ncbi:phage protease [Roseomonas sp. HJA6]|uniref:Phage protease n=1 Tax=Roseomonas alba TaxID=2846776 RepID=A0ABS7AI96_9PROT|nr:phage protease [Neoroseomonas alba]MBW6402040.1 phage protease [Neoroseomonas alba]
MPRTVITLHAALPAFDAEPPAWVQLVPPGTFRGVDGRGPYTANPARIVADSAQHLPAVVDEMHATDLGAKSGQAARACGWIVELQDRGAGAEGGVWGRVEWTEDGDRLLRGKSYRGISPAIAVAEKTGVVLGVLRASLTNRPNLPIKPLLQSEQGTAMDLTEFLRQLLGLGADADDTAIRTSLQAMIGDRTLQSQMRTALKLKADAPAAEVLIALNARVTEAGQVVELQTQVTELRTTQKRTAAEAVVDAAIRAGKAAINAAREHYITLHMQDPEAAKAMMDAIPSVHSGGLPDKKTGLPATADLSEDDKAVVALMNIDPEAFKKQRAKGTGPVEIITGAEG